MPSQEALKPEVRIYTSSGKLIKSVPWDKGRIHSWGWSESEQLLILLDTATLVIYNLQGEETTLFLGKEIADQGVLDCKFWPTGLVIVTKQLFFYTMTGFGPEPKVMRLVDPKLDGPPASWCIVEPRFTTSHHVEILISTQTGKMLVLNYEGITERPHNKGKFVKMTVSPTGKILAGFTSTGNLWVGPLDFSRDLSELKIEDKTPEQMCWCGKDSVVMYWPHGGLLIAVGPSGKHIGYSYKDHVLLVSEIDGVRIISNLLCETLERVPEVTEAIFKNPNQAASKLYLAYDYFESKIPRADDEIRQIRSANQLKDAVDACIEATVHEFSPNVQGRLLRSASFGKGYLDYYPADQFMKICKYLRVLNSVRDCEIGLPLTWDQFHALGEKNLIERLTRRFQHLLAIRICDYLHLDSNKTQVMDNWACAKVKKKEVDDREILNSVVPKLKDTPGISWVQIASAAFKYQRKELATKLLDYESRSAEQVPLLIYMKEEDLALDKAIESGDTNLIYLVLINSRRSKSDADFFKLLKTRPEAASLLTLYCKQTDYGVLRKINVSLGRESENIDLDVVDSIAQPEIDNVIKGLKVNASSYAQNKQTFNQNITQNEVRLLLMQKELEATYTKEGVRFLRGSLSDTIYRCITVGDLIRARSIQKDFKVAEKRFYWIVIRAYADKGDWTGLDVFSKKTKSPIGYKPFAEICIEKGNNQEAALYIAKMPDLAEKVNMLTGIDMWREAADFAMEARNPDLAMQIGQRAPKREDQEYIQALLEGRAKRK